MCIIYNGSVRITILCVIIAEIPYSDELYNGDSKMELTLVRRHWSVGSWPILGNVSANLIRHLAQTGVSLVCDHCHQRHGYVPELVVSVQLPDVSRHKLLCISVAVLSL